MIRLIYGARGVGKTARLVDNANKQAINGNSVVFITDSWRHKFELKYQIRLVNISEYGISGYEGLAGFVEGMIAADSDIKYIYMDCSHAVWDRNIANAEGFFLAMDSTANRHKLDVSIAIRGVTLPACTDNYEKERIE